MTENNQNYLTKAELAEFTEETLLPAIEKIMDDKLVPINSRLDSIDARLDAIETDLADIKKRLYKIDIRTDEDIRASYGEIEELKQRVRDLENQVKMLKAENA